MVSAKTGHHDQVEFGLRKARKQFTPGVNLRFDVIFNLVGSFLPLKAIKQLLGIHIIEVFDKFVLAVLPTLIFVSDLKQQKPVRNQLND